MVKLIFAAAAFAVAVASEHHLFDDGLSLLQVRAHKHEAQEEEEFYVAAVNTMCPDGEIITFEKCLFVQFNYPSISQQVQLAHGLTYLGRQWGMKPIGCFLDQANRLVFNDEPRDQSRPSARARPICQRGGGGGRMAELAEQKISCERDNRNGVVEGMHLTGHGDGCDPDGFRQPWAANLNSRRLNWEDSSLVVVPSLTLGARGSVCEETCALLTLEQCTRASDSGELEQLTGYTGGWNRGTPISQHFGDGGRPGSMPSGCSWSGRDTFYFSPLDTPSGARAGPGGEPWETPSGVGTGWHQVSPICGVCETTTTTTTTTTEPPEEGPPADEVPADELPADEVGDAAAALGDPHMQTSSGAGFDLQKSSLKH